MGGGDMAEMTHLGSERVPWARVLLHRPHHLRQWLAPHHIFPTVGRAHVHCEQVAHPDPSSQGEAMSGRALAATSDGLRRLIIMFMCVRRGM